MVVSASCCGVAFFQRKISVFSITLSLILHPNKEMNYFKRRKLKFWIGLELSLSEDLWRPLYRQGCGQEMSSQSDRLLHINSNFCKLKSGNIVKGWLPDGP
ncbi:hypothetical protein CHARACLAT_006492 [Characodon lateralis]|uniref:Uncharacterized protein n=1 Tax=Characodon lateralis TaxID=208331 RepID=A0ABU7E8U3_9TELE|nr:hypothetical protein [Characodon lateralis]